MGKLGLGLLQSAEAVGAVFMAVLLTHLPPMKRAGRTMLWAVAVFGAATIGFGLSPWFPVSLAMMFLIGAVDNVSVVVRHTLVQMLTPDAMRGRVSAVNAIFIVASNDIGGLESGFTARLFRRGRLGGPRRRRRDRRDARRGPLLAANPDHRLAQGRPPRGTFHHAPLGTGRFDRGGGGRVRILDFGFWIFVCDGPRSNACGKRGQAPWRRRSCVCHTRLCHGATSPFPANPKIRRGLALVTSPAKLVILLETLKPSLAQHLTVHGGTGSFGPAYGRPERFAVACRTPDRGANEGKLLCLQCLRFAPRGRP